MTQKFKFGDLVCYGGNPNDIGVVIKLYPKENLVRILWEGNNFDNSVTSTTLEKIDGGDIEPIPHPDTVRLDWIEENGVQITPLSIPTGGGDFDGGWELSKEYTNGDVFIFNYPYELEPPLRNCIDTAMEQE